MDLCNYFYFSVISIYFFILTDKVADLCGNDTDPDPDPIVKKNWIRIKPNKIHT